MARAFFVVTILFAMAYAFALFIFIVGAYGLFGAERDPLSGVFLIPLGLPWNQFIDAFPERLWPWLAAVAPLFNIAILAVIGRAFAGKKAFDPRGHP